MRRRVSWGRQNFGVKSIFQFWYRPFAGAANLFWPELFLPDSLCNIRWSCFGFIAFGVSKTSGAKFRKCFSLNGSGNVPVFSPDLFRTSRTYFCICLVLVLTFTIHYFFGPKPMNKYWHFFLIDYVSFWSKVPVDSKLHECSLRTHGWRSTGGG